MSAAFTIIDDRDPTVAYTGTWTVGGTTHEHDGTVSSSLDVGDHFVVPFEGTGISVYGTFDASSGGVKTSYSIDGGSANTVTSGSSGADSYQQLFWASPPISNGTHKLTVTMVAINPNQGDGEGTVWFDYFNATQDNAASGSASVTGSPVVNTASQASHTSATGTSSSASSTATSTNAAAATTTKKTSHTAVVAAVVVVLIVAVLIILGIWQRKRRQSQNYYLSEGAGLNGPSGGAPKMQPFLQGAPPTPMSGVPGAPPAVYGNAAPALFYAPPPSPGGVDPRLTHAAPAAPQGGYDPYASIGGSMFPYAASASGAPSGPTSTYTPSVLGVSSTTATSSRGPLTVVGGASTAVDPDSVAELKRKQKQLVDSYEQGIGSGSSNHQGGFQHTDSGLRGDSLDVRHTEGPVELPPVYTPN